MAEAKVKSEITMKMSATCPHHARSDVSVRDVETVIDEPTERGGTNLGMTPTETLVAALIGCTNVITQRISEGYDLHIDGMDIDVEAQFDRRGVMLQDEIALPFPSMTLNINIKSPNDAAEFEKVKEDLQKFCPIAKVIRESGTVINENWNISNG
jgi:putative redox protein|tara:strand:- start:32 stop:496 length:465 start_codon:yes stop_codon:yes gene_type:complete